MSASIESALELRPICAKLAGMTRINVRLKKRLNPPRRTGRDRTRTYTLVWRQDGKLRREALRTVKTEEEAEKWRQQKEEELNIGSDFERLFGDLLEKLRSEFGELVARLSIVEEKVERLSEHISN